MGEALGASTLKDMLAAKIGSTFAGGAFKPPGERGFLGGLSSGLQSGGSAMKEAISPIKGATDIWGRVGEFLGGAMGARSPIGRAAGTGLSWQEEQLPGGSKPDLRDLLRRIALMGFGGSPWGA